MGEGEEEVGERPPLARCSCEAPEQQRMSRRVVTHSYSAYTPTTSGQRHGQWSSEA
jgi:hypothetical protein